MGLPMRQMSRPPPHVAGSPAPGGLRLASVTSCPFTQIDAAPSVSAVKV